MPVVKNKSWPRNEIDRFVLARLEAEKLSPQVEADRHTLARRLHLDITGLPPTWDEVQSFVKDASPDAYAKLVDRLLAKPRRRRVVAQPTTTTRAALDLRHELFEPRPKQRRNSRCFFERGVETLELKSEVWVC